MQLPNYPKAALLTLLLVVSFIAGWETYWRNQGFPISYNDDESLWAYKREQIYSSTIPAPVIIGSSRIKFDIDLKVWEKVAGKKPIQLALVGTSPRPVLKDLAQDEKFTGLVVVDVTESSFFTPSGSPSELAALKRIAFYPKWSPSQQAGFAINRVLEGNFVFLDDRFSLTALLPAISLPKREGLKGLPNFPREWTNVTFDRQTLMGEKVLSDTSLLNQVKGIWEARGMSIVKGPIGDTLTAILDEVKLNIDKIKLRGGEVLFVRTPSSGPLLAHEKKVFPREMYWDKLLAHTQAPGIHFEDYPQLSRYECPEWSHLTPADAIPFTISLIKIMQQKSPEWFPADFSTLSSTPINR